MSARLTRNCSGRFSTSLYYRNSAAVSSGTSNRSATQSKRTRLAPFRLLKTVTMTHVFTVHALTLETSQVGSGALRRR
jgi:hypothetical protein